MTKERVLLILSNPEVSQILERAVLSPLGYQVMIASDWKEVEATLQINPPDTIIASNTFNGEDLLEKGKRILKQFPLMPIIILPDTHSENLALRTIRYGFFDYLEPPIRALDIQAAIDRGVERRRRIQNLINLATTKGIKELQGRVSGLETVQIIGREVTSTLDLESIFKAVVDASIELSDAEEGSLLLLDEKTGELYIKACRNYQDNTVNNFHIPVRNSLINQVIRSGKPLIIDEKTPKEIRTSFSVYSIIFVPLIVQNRVIGILEVDHRMVRKSFSDHQIVLVSALADYAAIAIENSNLYNRSESERNKLKTILTGIEEGVIVIDEDQRIVLINRKAAEIFQIAENYVVGKRIQDIMDNQELLEILSHSPLTHVSNFELTLENGCVINTQFSSLTSIGMVISMQDITHIKELDRIKSDFVSTVSHDLRSPLTSILGYVELFDRVGPVNDQQKEFIQRIQLSVQNITSLINDLLDLGRIEAGFDSKNEVISFALIIRYAIDSLRKRVAEESHKLDWDIPDNLPHVLGNPVRLRQAVSNIISNSIKFTPKGGKISITVREVGSQIILQVSDNGLGIPPADQPHIFEKFYRGSNVPPDTQGTGLGLAIVKSIVENHQGRVWAESTLGIGSTFTIVLPTIEKVY